MDARQRWTLGLILLLGISACDGRNLFQPVTEPPTIVEFSAPESVNLGEELPVRVRAIGVADLDSIVVEVRTEGLSGGQTFTADGDGTDMIREFDVEIPASPSVGGIELVARAYDEYENVSAEATLSAFFLDAIPPVITGATANPRTVGQGDTVTVSFGASDNIGLDGVGMRVRDPQGSVLSSYIQPASGPQTSATFQWPVSEDRTPGSYTIEVWADDTAGNRTVEGVGSVEVEFRDRIPPVVTILMPEWDQEVEAGDSLFVRFRVQDEGLFRDVTIEGISFRGDPDLGTDETINRFDGWSINLNNAVNDTTLTRYLQPTGDPVEEPGFIIVTATDLAGNVGADTVRVQLRDEDDS